MRLDAPSRSSTSAPLTPNAIARLILCASPPLKLDHSRSHSSSSMPHSFAIRAVEDSLSSFAALDLDLDLEPSVLGV